MEDLASVNLAGQTRGFPYDWLQRQTQASNPESGTVNYTYDNVGNMLTRTDNRQIVTTYSYDAVNRPTHVSYSDGVTAAATLTYDGAGANSTGQLTAVSNGNSTTNYTAFDVMGNVLASNQVTGRQTYSFAYGCTHQLLVRRGTPVWA